MNNKQIRIYFDDINSSIADMKYMEELLEILKNKFNFNFNITVEELK